jgi:hypothetical protein
MPARTGPNPEIFMHYDNQPFLMSDVIERAYGDPERNEYRNSRVKQPPVMYFIPFSPLLMSATFERAYARSCPDSQKPMRAERLVRSLGRILRKGVLVLRRSIGGSRHAHA